MNNWKKRVIIGGLPRSGSTLLRFILDRVPNVIAGPETNFFRMPLWHSQVKAEAISKYISNKFEIEPSLIFEAINTSNSSVEAFDKIISLYSDNNSVDSNIWAEKSPNNCYSYHRLLAENPDMYFISTIRHGLDVVTSKIEAHPVNKDYWCPVQRYIDDCNAIANFHHKNHFILKYEDLVFSPEETAGKLFAFLEIDFQSQYINDFNSKSSTRDLTKVVNEEKLKGPLSCKWVDRWREPKHNEKVCEFMNSSLAMKWLKYFEYEI